MEHTRRVFGSSLFRYVCTAAAIASYSRMQLQNHALVTNEEAARIGVVLSHMMQLTERTIGAWSETPAAEVAVTSSAVMHDQISID